MPLAGENIQSCLRGGGVGGVVQWWYVYGIRLSGRGFMHNGVNHQYPTTSFCGVPMM